MNVSFRKHTFITTDTYVIFNGKFKGLAIHSLYNKVGLDVVSLSGWFVVCVIVSADNERNIEVS